MSAVRRINVDARSTATFGRVAWAARGQHFIADGPVANGCPGEAITPPELFLAGVATCAVELLAVIARDTGIAVGDISASIEGTIDPEHPVRNDVRVFNSVRLTVDVSGVTSQEADSLVEAFKAR